MHTRIHTSLGNTPKHTGLNHVVRNTRQGFRKHQKYILIQNNKITHHVHTRHADAHYLVLDENERKRETSTVAFIQIT